MRFHALARVTYEVSTSGRRAEAIQAALAAVRLEPLRETAHAALIKARLAEGNRSEASRRCRNVLAADMAVEPSESIRKLVFGSAVLSGSILVGRPDETEAKLEPGPLGGSREPRSVGHILRTRPLPAAAIRR
jgi:hypothetical protein